MVRLTIVACEKGRSYSRHTTYISSLRGSAGSASSGEIHLVQDVVVAWVRLENPGVWREDGCRPKIIACAGFPPTRPGSARRWNGVLRGHTRMRRVSENIRSGSYTPAPLHQRDAFFMPAHLGIRFTQLHQDGKVIGIDIQRVAGVLRRAVGLSHIQAEERSVEVIKSEERINFYRAAGVR